MSERLLFGNVTAYCHVCGALTTFEHESSGTRFGHIDVSVEHWEHCDRYGGIVYQLVRCASCGSGALAVVSCEVPAHYGRTAAFLRAFYPRGIERARIPKGIPEGIVKEFREAEDCASNGANRAASALFRSVLEKTLRANGYGSAAKNLEGRIDAAAADGVITEARRKRAHEDIRVLGNDVLHDEWRSVDGEEVAAAHHYAQRVLEDFYDDRKSVERILVEKGRLSLKQKGSSKK